MSPLVVMAQENAPKSPSATVQSSATSNLRLDGIDVKAVVNAVLTSHSIRKRAIDTAIGYLMSDSQDRQSKRSFDLGLLVSQLPVALAGLTIIGAFKIAIIILSTFYAITAVFPSVLGLMGLTVMPITFRSVSNSIVDLKNLNYELVTQSLSTLPDKSFEALDIREAECKTRAICEMGSTLRTQFPTVATCIESLGEKFAPLIGDKYIHALVKGTQRLDCGISYSKCPTSPFQRWTDIAAVFR
ncbi:hypothetical protein HDE_02394 [Halotydeus destructor]|nr:hypothetical protein HDE_02394 [Halotydeus destructor]